MRCGGAADALRKRLAKRSGIAAEALRKRLGVRSGCAAAALRKRWGGALRVRLGSALEALRRRLGSATEGKGRAPPASTRLTVYRWSEAGARGASGRANELTMNWP